MLGSDERRSCWRAAWAKAAAGTPAATVAVNPHSRTSRRDASTGKSGSSFIDSILGARDQSRASFSLCNYRGGLSECGSEPIRQTASGLFGTERLNKILHEGHVHK